MYKGIKQRLGVVEEVGDGARVTREYCDSQKGARTSGAVTLYNDHRLHLCTEKHLKEEFCKSSV